MKKIINNKDFTILEQNLKITELEAYNKDFMNRLKEEGDIY